MEAISAIIKKYVAQYEHKVVFGYFNMSIKNSILQNLMQIYNLSLLIKEPTCFQLHNPVYIDNILTNQKAKQSSS